MNEVVTGLYFIAGGTGGIGSEVSRRLRGQGTDVALAARNEARLEERARELGARAVPMDATRPEAVTGAFDAALGEGRRLLGVVSCIGTILLKPAHLTSDEEWRTTVDTNLTSSFLLLREAFSRRHIESPPAAYPALVRTMVERCWGLSSDNFLAALGHRWRYARAAKSHTAPALPEGCYFAGDAPGTIDLERADRKANGHAIETSGAPHPGGSRCRSRAIAANSRQIPEPMRGLADNAQ